MNPINEPYYEIYPSSTIHTVDLDVDTLVKGNVKKVLVHAISIAYIKFKFKKIMNMKLIKDTNRPRITQKPLMNINLCNAGPSGLNREWIIISDNEYMMKDRVSYKAKYNLKKG